MTPPITLAAAHLVPLAKDLDENKVTPGVLGFIVFALLGGAVWLLMKSMNKQFAKIDFPEPEEPSEPGAADTVGGMGADSAAPTSASEPKRR
jgi:hypothetical protein